MYFKMHFFQKNSQQAFDYERFITFFEDLPNFKVYDNYGDHSNETQSIEIEYFDAISEFRYRYSITRTSLVPRIYSLDPMFTNINVSLELPVLTVPRLISNALNVARDVCREFSLYVFPETEDNVMSFDKNNIELLIKKMKVELLDELGTTNLLKFPEDKLSRICIFHENFKSYQEVYGPAFSIKPVVPVMDTMTGTYGMSTQWRLGTEAVFGPYIDFFFVITEEGEELVVPRDEFRKVMAKRLTEPRSEIYLPDVYVIEGRRARASRRDAKKLRKVATHKYNFKRGKFSEIIEEGL